MHFSKITSLVLLLGFISGTASARIWTDPEGKRFEGDFVRWDVPRQSIIVQSGDKEIALAVKSLGKADRVWLRDHAQAGKDPKPEDKKSEAKAPQDALFALLGKSPDEVTQALKTMHIVENFDSLQTSKVLRKKDKVEGSLHSYDNGKFLMRFYENKLSDIDLDLLKGYKGDLPFGLKKAMTQKEAKEILIQNHFDVIDWGHCPPGWGVAHACRDAPHHIAAIMTEQANSPELALIRLKVE